MFQRIAITALVLTVSAAAFGFNHGQRLHRQSLLMQSGRTEGAALKLRADGTMRAQEILFFNQKLNHKDPASTSFKQRYFIDSQYASGADAPVFYVICGEWNCAGTGSYSFVESMAKKMKAHLVALEHRFYGESLPTRKLTTGALKFLNLESAIEDLAQVQRFLMQSRGFKGKWISAGGSYAGTLAAFYRLKHPELVAGSLASSAPVLMKNEFKEYDAHIAKVINRSACGNRVREAVTAIEAKLASEQEALLVKKTFKATELTNNKDFLYVVADMLAAAVQYGQDKLFCQSLTNNPDPIKGYAEGGLAVLSAMGETPFGISLAVAQKLEVTPDDNMRQWLWQSCRQFGWFQVASGKGAARSAQIDLAYHEEICRRLYSVKMGKDGALNSQWYLPLFNPETSRIIFTNGSNDPWSTLSVTEATTQTNREFDLLLMEGAAHCNDLRLATNLPSVLQAHADIERTILGWLK